MVSTTMRGWRDGAVVSTLAQNSGSPMQSDAIRCNQMQSYAISTDDLGPELGVAHVDLRAVGDEGDLGEA